MKGLRLSAALAAVGAALLLAASAFADPTGSKNSFTAFAVCDNGLSVPIVVNNANGKGSGSQEQSTAEWAPAHVIGSTQVFHPTVFDLTFTFTAADGTSESQMQVDARPNGAVQTTCRISGSQHDSQGNTFSISGRVAGWLS